MWPRCKNRKTLSSLPTKTTAIYRATIKDQQKQFSTNKEMKEPQQDAQEERKQGTFKTHIPGWATQKWENNHNRKGSPQGARGLI